MTSKFAVRETEVPLMDVETIKVQSSRPRTVILDDIGFDGTFLETGFCLGRFGLATKSLTGSKGSSNFFSRSHYPQLLIRAA